MLRYCFVILTLLFSGINSSFAAKANANGNSECKASLSFETIRVGDSLAGWYECSHCHHKQSAIPEANGTQACASCSNPRNPKDPREAWQYDETFSEEDVIRREDPLAAKIRKKPNWTCSFCQGENMYDHTTCNGCGSPKATADTKRKDSNSGVVIEEDNPPVPAPRRSRIQRTSNKDFTPTREETTTHSAADPVPIPRVEVSPNNHQIKPIMQLAGGGIGLLLVGGGVIYLLDDDIDTFKGNVISMPWELSIERLSYTSVIRREWKDKLKDQDPRMPKNGVGEIAGVKNIRNCKEEVFSERPRILKERCDYDTFEWKSVEKVKAADKNPPKDATSLTWPKLEGEIGIHDKIVKKASYQVIIEYKFNGKKYQIPRTFENEREFLAWKTGEKVKVISKEESGLVYELVSSDERRELVNEYIPLGGGE